MCILLGTLCNTLLPAQARAKAAACCSIFTDMLSYAYTWESGNIHGSQEHDAEDSNRPLLKTSYSEANEKGSMEDQR